MSPEHQQAIDSLLAAIDRLDLTIPEDEQYPYAVAWGRLSHQVVEVQSEARKVRAVKRPVAAMGGMA